MSFQVTGVDSTEVSVGAGELLTSLTDVSEPVISLVGGLVMLTSLLTAAPGTKSFARADR